MTDLDDVRAMAEEGRSAELREFVLTGYVRTAGLRDMSPMEEALYLALKLADKDLTEEPEYEYGRVAPRVWEMRDRMGHTVTKLADTPGNVEYQRGHGYVIVRRTKAGEWEEVEA